jgi:hypothetical protein
MSFVPDPTYPSYGQWTFGHYTGITEGGQAALLQQLIPTVLLSNASVTENTATGTTIGTLSVGNQPSGSTGWTYALTSQSPAGLLAISGSNLNVAGAIDYESEQFLHATITASKSGQADVVTTINIAVINVLEVTLAALTLSSTVFTIGTPSSGTINGSYPGSSSISISGGPVGFDINGTARTWAYDGTGSPSSTTVVLTESYYDGINSPKTSNINVTVQNAPPVGLPAIAIAPVATQTTYPIQLTTDLAVIPATDRLQCIVSHNMDMSSPVYTSVWVTVGTSGPIVFPGLENFTLANGEIFVAVIRSNAAGSLVSDFSNLLKWGDVTAPTATGGGTFSYPDRSQISLPVTFSEPCNPVLAGPSAGAFQFTGVAPGTSFNVQMVGNGTLDYYSAPALDATVTGVDLGGNNSNVLSIHIDVIHNPAFDPPYDYTRATAGYEIARSGSIFQDVAGTTPAVANGDPVRRINDLSGNGYHLTMPTGGDYFILNVSGTKMWLTKHGPLSSLINTTLTLYPSNVWQRMSAVKFNSTPTDDRVWTPGDNASSYSGYLYFVAANDLAVFDGSGASNSTPVDLANHVIFENHESGNSYVKIDTVTPPAGAWAGNTTAPGICLGNSPAEPAGITSDMQFYAATLVSSTRFGSDEDVIRSWFNKLF